MLLKLQAIVAALLASLGVLSCQKAEEKARTSPSTYPIPITATTGMIADVIREIGGDKVVVTTLIGEGSDPHLYKPTRSDLISLNEADLIFYNGLKLEGKMEDIFTKMSQSKKVVAVTEALAQDPSVLLHDENHHDPHVWMDVALWKKAARAIQNTLQDFDTTNSESYALNAQSLMDQLEDLDNYARTSLATIPQQQRILVTAHDAFGYLGKAYGIEVKGIQGLSTESEAGVKDIEELVKFLVAKKIPSVFVETSVSDQNVKALLEGAKAKGHQVTIGGELFSDAMGPAGTYQGTYLGMIDHNVTTITRALGGTAPAKGFQEKLSE